MNNTQQRFEPLASLLLIGLVCTLSYGIFISQLGFYWDDYASMYVRDAFGSDTFVEWYGGQARPIGGVISAYVWEQAGNEPFLWHSINFGLYIASVVLVWACLRCIWPRYPSLSTLTALLFAVYPSYHLRAIPVSFQLILPLVIALLSIWVSLIAARRIQQSRLQAIGLGVFAALLLPIQTLIYEQYLVLEAIRPIAMLAVAGVSVQVARQLLFVWLPIAMTAFGALVYRFIIFEPNPTYASYNQFIYFDNADGLFLTLKRSLSAPLQMLTVDWVRVPWYLFSSERVDLDVPSLLAVGCLIGCLLYLWRYSENLLHPSQFTAMTVVVSLGMMGILLLAVHLVGRALDMGFNSRWSLAPSLFAAIIFGIGLPHVTRSPALGRLLMAGLITFGVIIQVGVTQNYADDWQLRQNLWWQMRWRAPEVEDGTLLSIIFAEEMLAFDRVMTDYAMTAQNNLYYPQTRYPTVVGGNKAILTGLLTTDAPRQGQWGQALTQRLSIFRDWQFDSERLLIFGYDGGCLITANTPTTISDFDLLSTLHTPNAITATPYDAVTFTPSYPEPLHDWCFYYQQVQWALQMNDITYAQQLAEAVLALGLSPVSGHAIEWAPFVEVYQLVGDQDTATRLQFRMDSVQ